MRSIRDRLKREVKETKRELGLERKYLTLDRVRQLGSMQTYPVPYRYSIITVIILIFLLTSLIPGPNIPGLWIAKKLWRFV